jgi:hypothetical protein
VRFCQDGEECPVSKREKEVAERFGKAAAGRAAVAVAPEKVKVQRAQQVKEEKTMENCAHAAAVSLRAKKRNYKRGHKPKGAKSAPKSEATPPRKTAAKPAREKSAKQKPLTRAAAAAGNGGVAVATICVPEAALDRFWTGLSVEEKAAAFTEYLGRE